MRLDPGAIGSLIREIAAEEILPRFRALSPAEVHQKASESDPLDIVTEADLATERRLARALTDALPGSRVVGEEAASADPRLLLEEASPSATPVWWLDPLDGTKNFAAGEPHFGTMLALTRHGETLAAWLHLTVDDRLYVAERGAGAFRDGVRLRSDAAPAPADRPRGTLYTKHMPAPLRDRVESRARDRLLHVAAPGSAIIEYTALAEGRKDFAIYHRLLPWDHAPGVLLLEEAGGRVLHSDGSRYSTALRSGPMVAARIAALAEAIRATILHGP